MKKKGHEKTRERPATDRHPIADAAFQYARAAEDWFKEGQAALRDKEEEVLAQARLGVRGVKEQVASLVEAVRTVRRYQRRIYVKLLRALDAKKGSKAGGESSRDTNALVKGALTAMDHSIAAWLRMKEFFPERTDSILNLLVDLDRLRRAADKEFPNARAFVPPGFDTVESAKSKRRN